MHALSFSSPAINLADILQQQPVWRGDAFLPPAQHVVSSGFAAVDVALGGGWMGGCIHELLLDKHGIGEFALLAKALCEVSDQAGWVAFVIPADGACFPYAPGLAAAGLDLQKLVLIRAPNRDLVWCYEQVLTSGAFMASVAWLNKVDARGLRRLQIAQQNQAGLAFIVRGLSAAQSTSPAPVRIKLMPVQATARSAARSIALDIFKRRGPPLAEPIVLPLAALDSALSIPLTLPLTAASHSSAQRNDYGLSTLAGAVFPISAD